jgi:RNA polymerase sigma-70 factor (ECF subfamily)
MTDEAWQSVRAAWPALSVERAAFARYAEARQPRDENLADLYLACACATGEARALSLFEQRFMPEVASYLRRATPALVDEVRQALRERLFVGASARISAYTGRGPLGAWLRTVAARLAVDLRASQPARATAEALSTTPDPELDYLKARYQPVFREALQAALAGLSVAERNMLRLHFLDGLTATQIAALERVAVSTVTRALERTRRRIVDETKRHFAARLALPRGESQSVLRLVRSHLDVSIRKFLG